MVSLTDAIGSALPLRDGNQEATVQVILYTPNPATALLSLCPAGKGFKTVSHLLSQQPAPLLPAAYIQPEAPPSLVARALQQRTHLCHLGTGLCALAFQPHAQHPYPAYAMQGMGLPA
eukprot:GHRR01014411.1.p1 GENE.GHRR01014411.1~~GHRR01014411.1.p1  ORF type:complete len:118 (+),score=16.51 GHRR01014411.1:1835-2188(+)